MLVHVKLVRHVFLKFVYILIQSKERPARTECMLAKLRVVLVTFGFYKNLIDWLRAVLARAESDST